MVASNQMRTTTRSVSLAAVLMVVIGGWAFAAGGGGGGGGGAGGGSGGGSGGGASGGGASGGGASGGGHTQTRSSDDLTTCPSGQLWDTRKKVCIQKRSGALPDRDLTEYAYALAKAERFQEALDVLDMLDNSETPRALNYRGYATRKLGRTDEGIRYYLKSVELDPSYAQVREYLGEAYVTLGKFDLAKDQLQTIERLCGSKACEYYEDLAEALEQAHAL
jgi:tetratricopeptide (TPR) repeat protein